MSQRAVASWAGIESSRLVFDTAVAMPGVC